MATYSRRERTTKRVEFVVPAPEPWGACWVEVNKAVAAAHYELVAAGRIKPDTDAPDDLIHIRPGDEDVVVSYEVETVQAERGDPSAVMVPLPGDPTCGEGR